MLKKGLFILGIIVIGLAVWSYFRITENQRESQMTTAMHAVPINAGVVVESTQVQELIQQLSQETNFWKSLCQSDAFAQLSHDMGVLDSLLSQEDQLTALLEHSPLNISVHYVGKENLGFLFLLNFSGHFNPSRATEFAAKILGNTPQTSRRYENEQIIEVQPTNAKADEHFFYAITNEIFIFSYSEILVEQAIRQTQANSSLQNDNGFGKVRKTAGKNVQANVYVNFKTFPRLLSVLMKNRYSQFLEQIQNFASWSAMDLIIKKEALIFSGYTYSPLRGKEFLSVLKNQDPIPLPIVGKMPKTTSNYLIMGISDVELFHKNFQEYLRRNGEIQSYTQRIESIEKKYEINLEKLVYSHLKSQIAVVYTKTGTETQDYYALFDVNHGDELEEALVRLINKYVALNLKNLKDYKQILRLRETDYRVYKMPLGNLVQKMFGNMFSVPKAHFFTIFDDHIIFGKSVNSLRNFLLYNLEKRCLNNNRDYEKFAKLLNPKSNVQIYSDMARSPVFYADFFDRRHRYLLNKNVNTLSRFQGFGIQFLAADALFYNSLTLAHNPERESETETNWEIRLDSALSIKPALALNHYTRQQEIVVQDKSNTLYLINPYGKILWRKQLPETIVSDIYQIDYYNNSKLQLLFNTRNFLYAIDREGNFLENYPVRLPSPATNGLALFDYDGTKDYRIFLAAMNRRVYCFDKQAKPVQGWQFEKTAGFVIKPVQHFRVGEKDYIVFADQSQSYFLDRRGEPRIQTEKPVVKSINNSFFVDHSTSPATLITTGRTGELISVGFNGKVKTFNLGEYSQQHFFESADISGDNKPEFIFLDAKKLHVFDHSRKKRFAFAFGEKVQHPPAIYNFSKTDIRIGVFSEKEDKIFLIRNNGKLSKGFPLRGKSMFSITYPKVSGNKTMFSLIVGFEQNYLYNYEIE